MSNHCQITKMSSNKSDYDEEETVPEVKKPRLSSPAPQDASSDGPGCSSWTPSVSSARVEPELESCDSGLSDTGE